jgi:hypothetical protein
MKEGGQALLGGLDCTVHRNFFGAQINSFETLLPAPACLPRGGGEDPAAFRAVFIRAPAIIETGPGEVGRWEGMEKGRQKGGIMCAWCAFMGNAVLAVRTTLLAIAHASDCILCNCTWLSAPCRTQPTRSILCCLA